MDRRRLLLVAAALVAALGAALVFLYVQGAEDRAEQEFDAVQVLVVKQPIAAGESVTDAYAQAKIGLEQVPQGQVLPGAGDNGDAYDGQVALTALYPGEQLIPEKFGGATDVEAASSLTIPQGRMAVSVNLTDPARVAGFVNPGSEVTVFYTGPFEDDELSRVLLPRVTVLGVGSTTQVTTTTTDADGQQTTEQLPRTLLTLALTQDEAEKVLLAQTGGELAMGLLTGESTVRATEGLTPPGLFD